jgi:putative membrane protein
MTTFVRSFCLAALLAAGSAWGQQQTSDTSDNPHSTTAKDKQGSDTPASITSQQVEQAAKGSPDSLKYKDAKPSGNATSQSTEAAERGNPNSTQNKDRDKLGTGPMDGPDQMGDMDHDEMMNNATPQMRLQRLHLSNVHEIEMGKIAEQNGSDRIKSYARTLERDHQDADQKVQALAKKKNITLSDTLENPDMQKHLQMTKDRFSSLRGTDFDRAFTARMSMEHKKVISLVQKWRQDCNDQEVCSLIDTLLPKLQQHAQAADQLKTPAAQGRAPANR